MSSVTERSPVIHLLVLAVIASSSACGVLAGHRGAAIEGWVIDATTKQPLAGVIVVARWNLWGGLHSDDMGNLHLEETVSATDGSYRFAGWGPRSGKFMAHLDPSAPMLYAFKPGYELRLLVNDQYAPGARSNPRGSRWHGATLELAPSAEVDRDYFEWVQTPQDPCAWEHVPRFTTAALRHGAALYPNYLWQGQPTLESLDSLARDPRPKRCADPRDVLKELP